MYKTIFNYFGNVCEETVNFSFLPDFRQDITVEGAGIFSSDKPIIKHCGLVYADEEAEWFCEETEEVSNFFVTPRTKEIITDKGDDFNAGLNDLLKEARKEYNEQRQEEVRVYLYDAYRHCLKNPIGCNTYGLCGQYKYDLERKNVRKQFIDWCYNTPHTDCFILGRVTLTAGDRDGDLVDFIEPLAVIPLQVFFDDVPSYRQYVAMRRRLYYCVTELLGFTIKKEYNPDSLVAHRISTYMRKNNIIGGYPEAFIKEIKRAFAEGNVTELMKLYYVLYTPQDKRGICYSVVLPQTVATYTEEDRVFVRYDNRESGWKPVAEVYASRDYCRNATVVSYGKWKKVYKFNLR